MTEMQEQFPAMARDGRYADPLAFLTPADTSHVPVGRKCWSNFRLSHAGRAQPAFAQSTRSTPLNQRSLRYAGNASNNVH
jgi:hypothetical protein